MTKGCPDIQDSSQEPFLSSKVPMTLRTEGKTFVGGEGKAPEVAMPQIEKERSWAKPNQQPTGPRKKRPLGRLFSSFHKCIISRSHMLVIPALKYT